MCPVYMHNIYSYTVRIHRTLLLNLYSTYTIALTVDTVFLSLLLHVILLMVLSKQANGKILVQSEEPQWYVWEED